MVRLAPVAAAITGIVLAYSALTKFMSPRAFVSVMGDYGLFPEAMILPLATAAVALEFALGLMLLSGVGRRFAARIAMPMVVVFIVFIIRALATGMSDCGCFGEAISIPPRIELFLDFALLGLLIIVWRAGEDFAPARGRVAATFGWLTLCVGALIFLGRGPVVPTEESLGVEFDDLAVLAQANPPLAIPQEGFLFFFSGDCDHCWAYAGGVELMAQRIKDFRVVGITLSDAADLEGFREAFQPTYPIHVLPPREFNSLVRTYPAGIWIQGGRIAGSWAGFVPGLRQIAEEGGYFYEPPRVGSQDFGQEAGNPFGGTLRGRQ
jgi:uncharacterized membrane protein YphA (DoxX/SURF4 family)